MSEAFSFTALSNSLPGDILVTRGPPKHFNNSPIVARYLVLSNLAHTNLSSVSSQHRPAPGASSNHLCSSHCWTSAKDPSTRTCFLVCGDSGRETHSRRAPAGGGDGPRCGTQYIPQKLGLGDRWVSCNGTGQQWLLETPLSPSKCCFSSTALDTIEIYSNRLLILFLSLSHSQKNIF